MVYVVYILILSCFHANLFPVVVLLSYKYFIWYCLFGILLVLCVREIETLSDEYVICRESHFGNVSDNPSFAKQIEIYC